MEGWIGLDNDILLVVAPHSFRVGLYSLQNMFNNKMATKCKLFDSAISPMLHACIEIPPNKLLTH